MEVRQSNYHSGRKRVYSIKIIFLNWNLPRQKKSNCYNDKLKSV